MADIETVLFTRANVMVMACNSLLVDALNTTCVATAIVVSNNLLAFDYNS